jgi:putative ABC transport system substrate-binding protein
MKRREFITLLGSAAAVWPLGARAEEPKTIGILVTGNPSPEAFLKGFREGLKDAGLVEGQQVRLVIRSGEGNAALLAARAAELVALKPDVIVTSLTPPAQAAKQATHDIPIVMAPAGDPVATGLVASLARPGGNVTGITTAAAEVAGKSLELIRELFPASRRVAVLANDADPFTKPYLAQIEQGAKGLNFEIQPIMLRPSAPLEPAFEAMSANHADAVIVQGSLMRKEAVELAIKHRLPSLGSNRVWPAMGGLMSYSASFEEMYRQAADYVAKILSGRKPADLPVALSTKFNLVVNMNMAKAIGLSIPESFLTRADEVIE